MRVGVIGGGPAGAICAIELRHGATAGERPEVLLFDGKSFTQVGPQGCNMCAGVISGEVLAHLARLGVADPGRLIQREVTAHYFENLAGGVHIPREEASIFTVFRSAGPRMGEQIIAQSFDYLLMHTAEEAGVAHIPAHISEVEMPASPSAPFRLQTKTGDWYEVDVLVGAFGVNSALGQRFHKLGFGYRPPRTYHVSQAEIPVTADFLAAGSHNVIKVFTLGLPRIHFGALTPKRTHLTATVIGQDLSRKDLERFLTDPRLAPHLPPGWTLPPVYCYCHPRLPVTAARNVVADRLLIIGDAHISRYLKGGIDSAFFTGTLAAQAILAGDLSRRALHRGYVTPCRRRYLLDNACGRLLFLCNDLLSRTPAFARAALWLVEREAARPRWEDRHHTQILWHIFTGDAPYRTILQQAIRPAAVGRTLLALARSLLYRKKGTPS